jgi:hypothetical protein
VVPSIRQQCRSSGTALLEVTLSSPINWSVFYRTPIAISGLSRVPPQPLLAVQPFVQRRRASIAESATGDSHSD